MTVTQASPAQSAPPDFNDLARRAEAAIDRHPDQAASLYKQALHLRPTWSEGWLYMGATLLQLGRLPESLAALRRGTELAPQKGTAWAYLGLAEYEANEYKSALAHILKGESIGLADRPRFVAAVHSRAALLYLRVLNHAQALEQLRPLVKAGNDSLEVIEALGISALFFDCLPDHMSSGQKTLVDLAGRAAWAFLAEQPERAASIFSKLVADYPAQPGVHYMNGVYLLDRDPAAAEAEFRKELDISPAHVLARVQLALLLAQRGEPGAAETLAREAVKLQPSTALCQVTLGRTLLADGKTDEAIHALELGEKLAPDSSRTHFYLQQAYQRAGRPIEAKRQKEEFNRLRALEEPVTVPDR